jgi:hypothetical protein
MASSFAHQPRRLAVLSIELGRRRNTPEHTVRPHAPNRFNQPCMFLFLFEEAPIHFVEIALQQRERLAERVDLGRPTRLEHFDLVAFHLIAQPLDFASELDGLDPDLETARCTANSASA